MNTSDSQVIVLSTCHSRGWPPGHYSIVTFALSKRAAHWTQLRFTQVGVPANDYAAKNQGWWIHYWQSLTWLLERQPTKLKPP